MNSAKMGQFCHTVFLKSFLVISVVPWLVVAVITLNRWSSLNRGRQRPGCGCRHGRGHGSANFNVVNRDFVYRESYTMFSFTEKISLLLLPLRIAKWQKYS